MRLFVSSTPLVLRSYGKPWLRPFLKHMLTSRLKWLGCSRPCKRNGVGVEFASGAGIVCAALWLYAYSSSSICHVSSVQMLEFPRSRNTPARHES